MFNIITNYIERDKKKYKKRQLQLDKRMKHWQNNLLKLHFTRF